MWVLIAIAGAITFVFVVANAVNRRMRARVRSFVESAGGRVRSVKPTLQSRAEYSVVFESKRGDLRRAIARVKAGTVSIIEDQPYHHCLRAPPRPNSSSKVSLGHLEWEARIHDLPGYSKYVQLLRELSEGRRSMQLAESEDAFAAILQCVEMQSMSNRDGDSGGLEMSLSGKPVKFGWRAEGDSPNRVLSLFVRLD